MAVTTFAEIGPFAPIREEEIDRRAEEIDRRAEEIDQRESIRTTKDAFRFVHTESQDEIGARAKELEALLDEGLAVALAEFLKKT